MALRSVGQARNSLDREGGGHPPWLEFLDTSELIGLSSLIDLELGRYRKARDGLTDMLRLLPEHRQRNRLYYSVDLAIAHLSLRDMDAACTVARAVLDLAAQTGSSRASQMVATLAQRMGEVNDPQAIDWMDRYRSRTEVADE